MLDWFTKRGHKMGEQIVGKKVASNWLWRFFERCSAQIVTFIVGILLARILGPKAYETIALVTIITSILEVFVNGGFGNALIQKKDSDDLDFSSVFYFNMGLCLIIYALMFVTAPFISNFYNRQELTPIIWVMSLIVIISAIKNIQHAYVSRHMMFKKFFFSTILGTVISGIAGVAMAFAGCGVWALVAQVLLNPLIDTIVLWVTVKWRPKKMFSWQRLKTLISYGWKLLVSGLLDITTQKISGLIIAKQSTADPNLAYYQKGETFPSVLTGSINASIDSVLLPALSSEQDKKEKVKTMTRRAIKTSSFLIMPLMMGLAVCAKPIIHLILGDAWLPCVPFVQIFCFVYAFYPIHTANLNAIKAIGRSDTFLILEIIKDSVSIAAVIICARFGVMAIAYAVLGGSVFSQIVNAWPNRKLINYGYLSQLKDLLPTIILTIIMGALVYYIGSVNNYGVLTLIKQVLFGVIIYFLGAELFRLEALTYIKNIAKQLIKKE